jgi:uncharacterized protein
MAAALLALPVWSAEGDPQPVPALKARVTDQTGTLSAADEARIEGKLRAFETQKGAQIVVLIVGTTQPEAIFDYAFRVGEAWKLGRKGVDDGVLFVIAKNDRKLQILTGPGLQGTLTDAMSKRIISEIVAPRFRAGDFAGGIEQGVDKIIGLLQGEALPPPPQKKKAVSGGMNYETFFVMAMIAAFLVGPMLRTLLGRFLGATATGGITGAAAWWLAGGLLFPIAAGAIIFVVALLMGAAGFRNLRGGGGGGGWSIGGGSSSSGGGSSDSFSGGGGSFDGGGASGDW